MYITKKEIVKNKGEMMKENIKTIKWIINDHAFLIAALIVLLFTNFTQDEIKKLTDVIVCVILVITDVILGEIRKSHKLTQDTILTVLGNLERYQKIYEELTEEELKQKQKEKK